MFSHDVPEGLFKDTQDVKLKNPYEIAPSLFSIIDMIDDILTPADTKYHLKLCYPELTQFSFPCNEWIQNTHPLTTGLPGRYTPVNVTWNSASGGVNFRGMGKNNDRRNTIIDAAPSTSIWWFAIGALNNYGEGKIPGPDIKVSKVELYVKKTLPPQLGKTMKISLT